MAGRRRVTYSACDAPVSNARGTTGPAPADARRAPRTWRRSLWGIVGMGLLATAATEAPAAFTLNGQAIDDAATQRVVEKYTLVRRLDPVRFIGTLKTTEWLLDRPPFAATLARHLHPPLERYHITDTGSGTYEVDDQGALRGRLRLVARGPDRRIYFCRGQFRSLAHLLQVSGNMVFALEYREVRQGDESSVEVTPQLFVRLDNLLAHGILKLLGPLIHGIIDRRVASLTTATQIVSQRITQDPQGLYQEIRTWPDVRPEELEAYRRAFPTDERGS